MTNCAKCRDMMIEALYGELGAAEKDFLDTHLTSCPDCASEYSILGATLKVMDRRERRDPGSAFWDGYWERLNRRLEREDAAHLAPAFPAPASPASSHRPAGRLFASLRLPHAPRWVWQAAAAVALVAIGVFVGRSVLAPPRPQFASGSPTAPSAAGPLSPSTPAGAPGVTDASSLAVDYLERSQVLLLGLVNYDPKTDTGYTLDLPRKQALSRSLATEAASLSGALTDPRQQRLRELVSDLQVIMMQIANLGSGQDVEGLELVRQGVERRGILLKIDLTRMSRNAAPAARPQTRTAPSGGSTARPGEAKI